MPAEMFGGSFWWWCPVLGFLVSWDVRFVLFALRMGWLVSTGFCPVVDDSF